MSQYTVKQGDHLTKIARAHGFSDYRTIWDHPSNADLKKKRENPNILFPGDIVNIPDEDKELKKVTGSTEKKHTFEKKGKSLMLRLELRHWNNKPMADAECSLEVGGELFPGKTDAKGRVEIEIPSDAENGKLKLSEGPYRELPFKIGHLDPVDEITGQKGRLNNLGYNSGPVDDEDTAQFHSAVEEFQIDFFKTTTEVDGKCGTKTQKKMKEAYGC